MAKIPTFNAPMISDPNPVRAATDNAGASQFGHLADNALAYGAKVETDQATEAGAQDQAAAGTTPVAKNDGFFGFPTVYSEAYNKAANIAFVEAKKSQLENTTASLQQQYQNDPDTFQTKLNDFRSDFMANVPLKAQPQFDLLFQDHTARAVRSVNLTKMQQDFAVNQGTILDTFDRLTNKLTNSLASDPDGVTGTSQDAAASVAHLLDASTKPTTDPATGQTYPAVFSPATAVQMHAKLSEAIAKGSVMAKYNSLPTFDDKQSFINDILQGGRYTLPKLPGLNDSGEAQVPQTLAYQLGQELDTKLKQDKASMQGAVKSKFEDEAQSLYSFGKSIYPNLPQQIDAAGFLPEQATIMKKKLVDAGQFFQAADSIKTNTRDQDQAAIASLGIKDNSANTTPTMSIGDAIFRQEFRGTGTSPTSVDGAVGNAQIMPGTWKLYAKPGDNINNPADNKTVGQRIIDDLSNKFGGDPARIAVGYFSGPGNVAPAGSATPWIRNTSDGNGKTVSGYVTDVLARMGTTNGNIGIADDSAERKNNQDILQRAVAQKQALLEGPKDDPTKNDPAAFYDQYLPGLAASKSSADMTPHIDQQIAFQTNYGLRPDQMKFIPRADALNIANEIHDTEAKDPGQVPVKLAQLQQSYGRYWPQVYSQLVQQGKLNPASQALAMATRPEDGYWSKVLASGLSTTEPKLEDALGSAKTKNIKDQLATSLQDFNTTAAASGAGASLIDTVNHATRIIAMQYALGGGMTETQAADKAVDDFLNSRYDFVGSYRVPKGFGPTAQAATEAAQTAITPAELAAIPPRQNETLSAEQRQNVAAANARRGTWVTTPTDDGLQLLFPDKSPVVRADGSLVVLPFKSMDSTTPPVVLNQMPVMQ